MLSTRVESIILPHYIFFRYFTSLSDFGLILAESDLPLDTLQLVSNFDFFFGKPCPRQLLRFRLLIVPIADVLLIWAILDLEIDWVALQLLTRSLTIEIAFESESKSKIFYSRLELEELEESKELLLAISY